ncbi:hypothetical protein HA466_0025110 [Hirschfeldia incana]|nr:hypothetical protein HA466_0025110 [Hirschfeldia incana]KAJ0264101.1 hypothetical protein HA466_0025110 [Hirschfeldia incana]KAJ0264102.1 hypothetical protein HA466_0025110 [Hirschfeldia incana]
MPEVEMLEDDCFEGSYEEHQIFREVFFASCESGKATTTTKRCLVTGAITFECDDSCKNVVNSSLSSNNDNSVVTSGLEGSEPSSASEVNTNYVNSNYVKPYSDALNDSVYTCKASKCGRHVYLV